MKILLAEDSQDDREIVEMALEQMSIDYELLICRDGVSVIRILEENESIDLILLDWNLPKATGGAVLRWIKNNQKLKTIPVVVLSTSSRTEEVSSAYENYCNAYFVKPFDLEDSTEIIQQIIRFFQNAELP